MAIQINGKARPEIYSIYPAQDSMKVVFHAGNKTPNGQEKKGETKIINPVMRNYTLFLHSSLSGIKKLCYLYLESLIRSIISATKQMHSA